VAQLENQDRPTPPGIPATTQLLAIAWLRWRIFVNGFVRRQSGPRKVAGLVLTILLRVLLWPIFAMMAIGPAFGAGFLAWMSVSGHHPQRLVPLLAGIAIFWQFVAINGVTMAAAMSSFDPSSLLRFPLRFGRYLVLRLLLGLLTPSTIIGCLALFAACVGIGIADVSLVPAALLALAIYAAMNIFLARMIAAWMDRWLATRRARELFGGLMALFFVGLQFLNFRHTALHGHTHTADGSWLLNFLNGSNRFLSWLPPGFATNSILLTGHPLARLAQFAALLAWTALFFVAFAFRLHRQFLGEYLSEGAPRSVPSASPSSPAKQPRAAIAPQSEPERTLFSPIVTACLRKEWVYLRGNGGQLIGLLTPLIFVVIFSKGMLASHPSYLLSGAVGYALLGPLGALYNIFGADGTGVQLYLLAPVRPRDVVLAKNIASLALLLVEATLAWLVVWLLATAPIAFALQISAAFWIVFIVFTNLTLGTLRSIQAPRKIVPGQARKLRPAAASKTSGLLVLAILFGSILLQIPVTLLCRHFHNLWLGAGIFAPLAAAAIIAYGLLLNQADSLILTHRDLFAEELCGD
jgi:ABC-2 type transport system permease protein